MQRILPQHTLLLHQCTLRLVRLQPRSRTPAPLHHLLRLRPLLISHTATTIRSQLADQLLDGHLGRIFHTGHGPIFMPLG